MMQPHPYAKIIFPEWRKPYEKAKEKFESKLLGNISPSDTFVKKNLVAFNPMFKWTENVQMKLIIKRGSTIPNYLPEDDYIIMDSLDELKVLISEKAKCVDVKGIKKDRKIVSLDIETTGLDNNVKLINGQYESPMGIVGLPIGVSENEAYYIPTMHTEEDGILNWEPDEYKPLIKHLMTDEFHLVYHNAQFDMNVLMNNGMEVEPSELTDTMICSSLMNNFEFFPYGMGNGLKALSGYCLNRKMLEINEILGLDKKTFIQFNTLPAVNAYTYACADAANTFGLFKAFIVEDKYDRNPYKHQQLVTKVAHRMVYITISSIAYGMPIDYDHLISILKTINIRIITITRRFQKFIDKYKYQQFKISSPLIGNFIVHILKEEYDGDEDSFFSFIQKFLGITRKTQTLKGGVVKETFGTDDEVMSNIKKQLKDIEYLSDERKDDLYDIINSVSLIRSLVKEKSTYLAIISAAYKDDRNTVVTPIQLRLAATDTLRYASSKGKGIPRTLIYKTPSGKSISAKMDPGNGVTKALNSQGMSAIPYQEEEMNKIDKLPDKYQKMITQLEKEAEIMLYEDVANA